MSFLEKIPVTRIDIRETLHLAYPVVLGQLGHMLMSIVDSAMVGRIGAVPLAASAVAGGAFFLFLVFGLGISYAVSPLVAIALGSKNTERCTIIYKQSLYLNTATGIILAAAVYFGSDLIYYLNQPPEVARQAASYMQYLGFSVLPIMIFQTFKQFIEGHSVMKPAMAVAILANIVNGAACYVFVFGNFGFPRMELDGAGLATFLSRTAMAAGLAVLVIRDPRFAKYDFNPFPIVFIKPMIRKLLSLGVPSGIQYVFEVSAFAFSGIMVGWIGAVPLAAHQIALNLASVTYMVVLGISTAAAIRVGTAVGRGDILATRRAGFTALFLSIGFMLCTAALFIVFRSSLPYFYIADTEVVTAAASLLVIAALFQIFDGSQAVGLGILRGLTDVRFPTVITFIAYWIFGLPSAYLIGFTFGVGVTGVWIGMLIGLIISALLLTLRFHHKSKRSINV